jgi:hypothetical protein
MENNKEPLFQGPYDAAEVRAAHGLHGSGDGVGKGGDQEINPSIEIRDFGRISMDGCL